MKRTAVGRLIVKTRLEHRFQKANLQATRNPETPWVNDDIPNVDLAINYARKVFSDYLERAGLDQEQIGNKVILEIGPGKNLAVALLFLAAGAAKVTCVDKFPSFQSREQQGLIYRSLIDSLSTIEQERLKDVIQFENSGFELNASRLNFARVSAEEVFSVCPKGSVDWILSRAVLEHVFEIGKALNVFDEVLAPGGFMLHEVDFRDHGMFSASGFHPLFFLRYSQAQWNRMSDHVGAPNRKMCSYYLRFFQGKAYDLKALVVRTFMDDQRELSIPIPLDQKGRDKLFTESTGGGLYTRIWAWLNLWTSMSLPRFIAPKKPSQVKRISFPTISRRLFKSRTGERQRFSLHT
ncbi:MAG TPA: methyltransferase domain-containing protein [Fibrobacteraceae bacterium]|nr:methyltransferase domain-containing protein [Fibrobacteraceae bacterium]